MPPLSETESQVAPKNGLLLLQIFALCFFFVYAFRFWQLQVHKGEEFAVKAANNKLRQEAIFAPRGELRDRNGQLVAVNQPAYALAVVREDVPDINATLEQVSKWTTVPMDQLLDRYARGSSVQSRERVKPFQQLILVPDLSFDLVALIEANAVFWPGLEIVVRPRRVYLQGPLLSHILGYVAETNREDLEQDPELEGGDLVGRQGVEKVKEKELRGKKGLKEMEVDVTGRSLEERLLRPSKAGNGLNLTIDLDLQRTLANEMEGHAGGVVVMEPATGDLLALLTLPTYDNNVFTAGISSSQMQALQANPRAPLQNRVIQSTYPPGSVWKLVVAAAGLEEGLITPHTTFFCPGSYTLGKRVFRCWRSAGHGNLNLEQALVHSCDVYFYQLGEKLGVERISRYAKACGFGEPTGIDLPYEKGGLVPTPDWKRKRFREPWHGGETLNYSIGQGFTLVTPLQVARFLSALLNGGTLLKPKLLLDDPVVTQGRLPIREEWRKLLVQSMVSTVESGTGRSIKRPDAIMGAKTGTAQVVRLGQERRKTRDTPYRFRDHAWMASFGEKNNATYVVVNMIEHGGHGGSVAGPVVRDVYNHLFGDLSAANATATPAGGGNATQPSRVPRTTGVHTGVPPSAPPAGRPGVQSGSAQEPRASGEHRATVRPTARSAPAPAGTPQ
ncbi:penicillin-binding protein 2 [Megalodesulfovibrio paquesii]